MAPPVPLPFFCELCKKGYARISELEVHETSYDHHHRKRAADLRSANRDGARRDRQAASDGVMRVLGAEEHTSKKSSSVSSKRGFKSAFGVQDRTQNSDGTHVKPSKKQDVARVKTISELYGGAPRARRDSEKHESLASPISKVSALSDLKTEDTSDVKSKTCAKFNNIQPPPPSPHKPSIVFKQEPPIEYDDYVSSHFQPPSRTDKLEAEITGLSYTSR